MTLKPCPFCGRSPKSVGRPSTEGEKRDENERFVHFVSCFCGGYSACAHKMGRGSTAECAESDAVEKWNTRHNDNTDRMKLDKLMGDVDRCYQMLLSEPSSKGALFKAENILREALVDAKGPNDV